LGDDRLIRLPQLGLTMTEGMLVEWSVPAGGSVRAGDPLYVVETDKIANEILADRDGVLESILVQAEETVPVGAVLGMWAGRPGDTVQATHEHAPEEPPVVSGDGPSPGPGRRTTSAIPRIVATPHARKLAREQGVELSTLHGSGPEGRIVARDVHAAAPAVSTASTAARAGSADGVPLRGARKVIAARMLQAQQEIPHFYLTAAAEISELLWLHDGLKQKPGLGGVTLTHWIATAVGLVIAETPLFRTVYDDDRHFALTGSDVGIAVAVDDGLYAPVARDLGAHGLAENAAQIDRLLTLVRDGACTAASLSGGATTVSNLGGFDIAQVFPLINPGQSSILGVGRQQSLFRPDEDDAPVLKRELGLVLACDHRVFNGVDGARMLQAIVDLLEDPLLIIAQARR
jgi:pyruvate dehydrogenase E2 component (dihydrolipoyllysine-residue acetyltransferase)